MYTQSVIDDTLITCGKFVVNDFIRFKSNHYCSGAAIRNSLDYRSVGDKLIVNGYNKK